MTNVRSIVNNDIELPASDFYATVERGRIVLTSLKEVDALVIRELYGLVVDVQSKNCRLRKVVSPYEH